MDFAVGVSADRLLHRGAGSFSPSDSSVLVSQEGSSGETASVSESVPSEQPAEKSEPETPLGPPDLILQGADLGDAEVECDRFFALFDQLPEAQKVGVEMPYSSQWIMPYIQFDADLYYYIRELDLYPQWQQYHDSYYVDGRQYQKTLYQLITFFDIPREKFEELCSDSIIPDSEWDEREKDIYHLKESMVDALYSSDPYTRNLTFCARRVPLWPRQMEKSTPDSGCSITPPLKRWSPHPLPRRN